MKKLLSDGEDVNIIGNNRNGISSTALIQASATRRKDICRHLLSHANINVNKVAHKNRTALFMASVNGRKDIVELLLTHKSIDITKADNHGETAITQAGNDEIKTILNAKINTGARGKVLLAPLNSYTQGDALIGEKVDKSIKREDGNVDVDDALTKKQQPKEI